VTRTHSESGFSIIELIVAMGVLLVVSSIVTSALLQMTSSQATIWNRTEMHSGIRGATELLQQEVGQAGRVTLPGTVTLASAVAAASLAAPCDPGVPGTNAVWVNVNTTVAGGSAVSGMFATAGPPAAYMMMTTMDGDKSESFRLASVSSSPARIFACFAGQHDANTVVVPLGGFATGIIAPAGVANGSTSTKLKLYGDINGDGNMVYVEYTCDPTTTHNLYRNVMPFDQNPATKPPLGDALILLGNIMPNPGLTPCFSYQTASMLVQGTTFTFVLDVAITLTVQTQEIDPVTKRFQTETKALLNVSPRNVFNTWSLASIGYTDRIQSTPASVTLLLP
jgi:prepilin-type N-terminal cleavage/methylation domain-containing protein